LDWNGYDSDIYVHLFFIPSKPQEIVFPSYDENGLIDILKKRVGKHVVDEKALELVARKIAATSGDARKAMEITAKATQLCKDSLSDDALSKEVGTGEKPPVKINHMMRAIRESNVIKHAHTIQKLPQLAKVVLCIAVAYGNVIGPKAEISMSHLKKICCHATKHSLFDDTDIGSISGLIGTLCDQDLLRVANNGHFDPHDLDTTLIIDVQLDDVECALEESLLNGEHGHFYSKLMDYVRQKHR
jgi:cell division control protein 6